ncbi:MAG: DUF4259 domain-containing protein [Bradymonadia bacterium]
MGAWGQGFFNQTGEQSGSFGNRAFADGALDFFGELEYSLWECIDDTLKQAVEAGDFTEGDLAADDGAAVVVIGELIAAALGRPGGDLPAYAAAASTLLYADAAAERMPMLLNALAVVNDPLASELAADKAEGPDWPQWCDALEELRHRLYAGLSALAEHQQPAKGAA